MTIRLGWCGWKWGKIEEGGGWTMERWQGVTFSSRMSLSQCLVDNTAGEHYHPLPPLFPLSPLSFPQPQHGAAWLALLARDRHYSQQTAFPLGIPDPLCQPDGMGRDGWEGVRWRVGGVGGLKKAHILLIRWTLKVIFINYSNINFITCTVTLFHLNQWIKCSQTVNSLPWFISCSRLLIYCG